MVLDEYGSVVGIVTLNDILEAVLGDLPEADREEEPRLVERRTARGCLMADSHSTSSANCSTWTSSLTEIFRRWPDSS